jgi:hypothetical protein
VRSAALGVLALFVATGCRCDPGTGSPSPPPAVVQTPPAVASSVPVPRDFRPSSSPFDRDRDHPFNRVHRALFLRRAQLRVPSCSLSDAGASCRSQNPTALLGAEGQLVEREIGHDELTTFIGGDAEFLADPARMAEAQAAISAAQGVAASASALARVLLQNDLWERYDAIGALLGSEHAAAGALRALRQRIADLMFVLALPAEALRGVASNQAEIAAAQPELLPEFASERGWVELRTISAERPGEEPTLVGTRHAERAGHRVAFRVLARIAADAGGYGWLEQRLKDEPHAQLPVESRLALVASPLAISTAGEIVPVATIVLVEIRVAKAEQHRIQTLDDAALDVLEGRRELLLRRPSPGGGLERLAPDALIPQGATCAPHTELLAPLRSTCVQCHGGTGARLTGPMRHGRTRFEIETDRSAAARQVAQKKAEASDFRELAARFRDRD